MQKSGLHNGSAETILETKHAGLMPDAVLQGWKCGYKLIQNSTENIVTVHENDKKDMAYAINAMEDAGYEVVNVHFERGVVEFMQ